MLVPLVKEPVLALPVVAVFALLPVPGKPVGTLPSRRLPKDRATLPEVFMDRRPSHPARRFDLPERIVVRIEETKGFGHALLQVPPVALKRLRAADINVPEIERRAPLVDPLGQRHARTTGRHDADRIVAGGHPVPVKVGSLPKIVAVVGSEAFGTVEESVNARGLEERHAIHGKFENRLEVLVVLRQRVEFEVLGNAVHSPGLRLGLESPKHHLSGIGLVVGAFVRHTEDGQMPDAVNGLGNEVEVFAGMKRQRDSRARRKLPRPHSAAIDDQFRARVARFAVDLPIDSRHLPIAFGDRRHSCALGDLHAPHPRAPSQRHRDVGRIALAVTRKMNGGHHILDVDVGIQRLDLFGADLVHLDAKGACQRRLAPNFLPPVLRQCNGERSHHPKSRRNACLGLEPLVETGRILGEPGHVLVGPQLTDQPGRMPGRATGQLLALQEQNVRPAPLGEVIGDRTAGHAAADDHGTGMLGKRAHG